jgi:hypothetical protein
MEILKKENEDNIKWQEERNLIVMKKLQAIINRQNNEREAFNISQRKLLTELERKRDVEIET